MRDPVSEDIPKHDRPGFSELPAGTDAGGDRGWRRGVADERSPWVLGGLHEAF
jgi:hypothetical protein